MTSRTLWSIGVLCCISSWGILSLADYAGFDVFPAKKVSGDVIYRGKPLPEGFIFFTPSKAGEGQLAYCMVENGRYSINPSWRLAEDHSVGYQIWVAPLSRGADGNWTTGQSPRRNARPGSGPYMPLYPDAIPVETLATISPSTSRVDINLN